MASEDKDTKNELAGDDDLEELLDSAIADFDKPIENDEPLVSAADSDDGVGAQAAEPWDAEFLLEAQKELEDNFKRLLSGGDGTLPPVPGDLGAHFQKLAEDANRVFTENQIDPEFTATIAQSLKTLSEETENIQTPLDPEALASMLGDLNLGGNDGSTDFLPLMQTMMQSILSKDVLYPSLKDVCSKYPLWLEEHKDSLSDSDYANYSKQNKIMEDVCKEFEAEAQTDSEETKASRFKRVLSLMEEMQKLGQPPKELVGDNGTFLDGNALPSVDPSQCSLM